MDTISPLSIISPIGSSTSQGKGHSRQQQPSGYPRLLQALVLENKGNKQFILEIGGSRQAVSSEAPLTLGQTLKLQVMATEPEIQLKIVSSPQNPLQGRSLTLLANNIDLAELFQAFRQHKPTPLETVSPVSRSVLESFFTLQQSGINGRDGGVLLKNLVESLGLNMEQLLEKGEKNSAVHTLKAALLELAHTFRSAESIAEKTNKILATLELFQLAQLKISNESLLIFPLPLPFIEQGYLVVERETNNDSSPADHGVSRFSLHLSVSSLGNLQIDFLQNQEGLFIRFRAEDQQKATFIESFAEELQEAISEIPSLQLSFSADAPDPVQDLVQHLISDGNAMLDTKV